MVKRERMPRGRAVILTAVLLMATFVFAQGRETSPSSPKDAAQHKAQSGSTGKRGARQGVQKPNVILITIDTVRADHVGCYGAKDVKTPELDRLAQDGVLFERAISQVPLTWPSHAVILTGTYPFQNGVQDFTGEPLGERFLSVAQVFKDAGYATGAVVSAFVLD